MNDQILSIVRTVLKVGGSALATYGIIQTSEVDTLVGALVALIGVGASIWTHYHPSKPAA